jgi:hypothetical protein
MLAVHIFVHAGFCRRHTAPDCVGALDMCREMVQLCVNLILVLLVIVLELVKLNKGVNVR